MLTLLSGCALMTDPDRVGGHQYSARSPQASYAQTADYSTYAHRVARAETETVSDSTSAPGLAEYRPLTEFTHEQTWPVTLLEVVRLALNNNEVIPVDVQFLSSNSPLMNAPGAVDSIYDPVIQAMSVAGSRGSVAASSDFVPQFSARSTWGQDNVIQNNLVSAGLPAGAVLQSETGNLELSVQQRLKAGGNLQLSHNTDFNSNNAVSNLFPNVYTGDVAVDFTQPLWSGAGEFFTSIAGPIDLISTRTPTVDQGIVITRINEQLTYNQFQVALRQLVKDVQDVYQDLNFAHRRYRIERRARDSAKDIWDRVQAKTDSGVGDGLGAEAQAEESYYAAEARVKDALSQIALTENRLRRLIGAGPGQNMVIQPADFPDVSGPAEDWEQSLQTAFARRPELNESMLTIQSLELQRSASKSLSKPRLDLITNFHVNGFGDRPFNESARGTIRRDSYYQNLLRAEKTGWFAGAQFTIPFDQRLARSLEHELEYDLAKSRAALHAQKKEISHELWHAYRSAERWKQQVDENRRRVDAARRQVDALEAADQTGQVSVDLLVRAQATQAAAETEFARVKTEYNKANADIRFRRGTLLEDLHISVQDASEQVGPQLSPLQLPPVTRSGDSTSRRS